MTVLDALLDLWVAGEHAAGVAFVLWAVYGLLEWATERK